MDNPPPLFMFYVYLLQSKKDKKLYIGLTNNLRRRVNEHNSKMTLSTKYRVPFKVIYYEAYFSRTDAKERERKLKQFKNSYTELKKRLKNSLNNPHE